MSSSIIIIIISVLFNNILEDLRGKLKRAGLLRLLDTIRRQYDKGLAILTLSQLQPSQSQTEQEISNEGVLEVTRQIETNLGIHCRYCE